MSYPYFLWSVIVLVILIVGFYWAKTLRQLRQTLSSVEKLAGTLDKQLMPLLSELQETVGHVKSMTSHADEGVATVSRAFDAVGRTADRIGDLGTIFRQSINPQAILLASLLVGIQAAARTFLSRAKRTY